MPDIDVVDSTWIRARPAAVAAAVVDPGNWPHWWPELELVVQEWRGETGMRWFARTRRGAETGSMEFWLEPAFDGVVAHYFLRLDSSDGRPIRRRRVARLSNRHRRRVKRALWTLSDQLAPARHGHAGPEEAG